MKELKARRDPVAPDQAGRLMPVDPLGINASAEQVKRKFDVNASQENVIRQRAAKVSGSVVLTPTRKSAMTRAAAKTMLPRPRAARHGYACVCHRRGAAGGDF